MNPNIEIIKNFYKKLYVFEYHQILEEFINIFTTQCGKLQFEEVKRRIDSSNTFNKLISKSKINRSYFNDQTIVGGLLTIPYFMFKGGYVQFLASLLVLERWNKEVNFLYGLLDEQELRNIATDMFSYIDRTRGFKI